MPAPSLRAFFRLGSCYTGQHITKEPTNGNIRFPIERAEYAVTGTGSVNASVEGQYTITYPGAGVVDSAGNTALDATRTVNVVADIPPGLAMLRNKRVQLGIGVGL